MPTLDYNYSCNSLTFYVLTANIHCIDRHSEEGERHAAMGQGSDSNPGLSPIWHVVVCSKP